MPLVAKTLKYGNIAENDTTTRVFMHTETLINLGYCEIIYSFNAC